MEASEPDELQGFESILMSALDVSGSKISMDVSIVVSVGECTEDGLNNQSDGTLTMVFTRRLVPFDYVLTVSDVFSHLVVVHLL